MYRVKSRRARELPVSASRRLASLVDVSLEEEEEKEEEKEEENAEKSTEETEKKLEPLAYTQSAPPPKQRRDPVWWMNSTASLKVRIPPNHVIQSQFNLASVSSFDVKAYTMHDLLDWDFHVLSLPEPEAVRLCR
ncbi:high-affinity cGMP-specific 3',5'-cyclic phosphodiesterase 9A, putative [Eimeria mitis]|uniref:High-affinity cGMP-specific 3',5'-cyclic phosphodiesterase 9A, putative n=1 Tax=Eimeria mitis TaxID=44415 RepID=U6KCF9_9EIME|nr:high-affinity cGMP-specific 3',5'-cyclic phosphodiesterase 9A, putative [Eimeria mitis]CDJ34466.1 high-affinity cGMP-specific 3',5'-cyclic phosphodiesterase 9A, putative [Eimeria mitis]